MAKIELSDNERRALVQLIDLAVKAGGLNVAGAAAQLAAKFAVDEPPPEDPEETV
tara:strand:+ start:148 stop:312 length:165 start_codon:yes stop_codon:yes gene_type:complete